LTQINATADAPINLSPSTLLTMLVIPAIYVVLRDAEKPTAVR